MSEEPFYFGVNTNWVVKDCIATITASGHIDRGEYIHPTVQGTVQKCTVTEILTDPFGDLHNPHIIGYTIDTIEDGGTGRAVITM